MLTRITGQLERVEPVSNAGASGCASCVVGLDIGLAYEVLLPSYTAASLLDRVGSAITLHMGEVLEQGASA